MNILFSPPDITEEEIQAVSEALRSGWITTGPRTKEFERNIAQFTGCNRAACLNSATACLETALRLLGIGEGDEVIVPAYTYTASASVVAHVNAKLVLIDVEKDTYHLDYDALEAAINESTKAVIPVDIGGVMVDYDRIRKIVERKKNIFMAALKRMEICPTRRFTRLQTKGNKNLWQHYSNQFCPSTMIPTFSRLPHFLLMR